VILLPQLQECNDHPCDCGSSRADLEANPEYAGLDFSTLTDDWTSKQGFYASDVKTLQARARWNRRWLRERPEKSIVLVAHGDCLRYLTEGETAYVSSHVVPRLKERQVTTLMRFGLTPRCGSTRSLPRTTRRRHSFWCAR
jgi:broad specificity phosphatase PhoE